MGAAIEVTQPSRAVDIPGSASASLSPPQQHLFKDSAVVEFAPCIRSGVWYDIGARQNMEDEHVVIDDLVDYLGPQIMGTASGSFYGVRTTRFKLFQKVVPASLQWLRNKVTSFKAIPVQGRQKLYMNRVFDGHDGRNAAQFVKDKLLKFIVSDVAFPSAVEEAVQHAFLQTDAAFAEACSLNQGLSSGTTAITVLVLGREIFVANAGDCRAVLCRKGKAIEMSRDHKPNEEKSRIEALGGFIYDGYLNGQLSVARAIGNWHIEGLKGENCPLSAEPEVKHAPLTEDDEFMIIGCDGFWDVFTNENAVAFARRKLQQHNDPGQCSHELVDEALRRNTSDNLTVVVVCFQRNPPPRLLSRFLVRRQFRADSSG